MDIRTDAKYHFNDRLKGETRFELFNDHYLRTCSRRMKKEREFKMEVATLNPEPQKVEDIAWHWLVAAILSLGGLVYFIYYLIASSGESELLTILGGIAALLLLTAAFGLAFWIGSERKWVFKTRAAQYPLVVVPFRNGNRKQAGEFVERLQQAITATTDKKGYSKDDLFAGEMRMLRRLSKAGIISDSIYDSAKKHMLGNSKRIAEAVSG